MKVVEYERLLDEGRFSRSAVFKVLEAEVMEAIDHVRWPEGSNDFTVKPVLDGNGVKVIKNGFISVLRSRGWEPEHRYAPDEEGVHPGAFDASKDLHDVNLPPFVAEWETGNISSSHRAINKMGLGLLQERLSGGVIVLPSRRLYRFLTDRVGNYRELTPYFPLWRSLPVARGFLAVIAVEHDRESLNVPHIPKGTDGRALG
jgi:hypothetical protein